MNRRRPWHQRLVCKVTRKAPLKAAMTPSPLSILFGLNVLGSIIALLSGTVIVAAVLASLGIACVACQLRQRPGFRI